jgi:hypothetical protein
MVIYFISYQRQSLLRRPVPLASAIVPLPLLGPVIRIPDHQNGLTMSESARSSKWV